jgi:hypothetical protein
LRDRERLDRADTVVVVGVNASTEKDGDDDDDEVAASKSAAANVDVLHFIAKLYLFHSTSIGLFLRFAASQQ